MKKKKIEGKCEKEINLNEYPCDIFERNENYIEKRKKNKENVKNERRFKEYYRNIPETYLKRMRKI